METLVEAKVRRLGWKIPRHGLFPQCFKCGRVAMGHGKVGERYVPLCGEGHAGKGMRGRACGEGHARKSEA